MNKSTAKAKSCKRPTHGGQSGTLERSLATWFLDFKVVNIRSTCPELPHKVEKQHGARDIRQWVRDVTCGMFATSYCNYDLSTSAQSALICPAWWVTAPRHRDGTADQTRLVFSATPSVTVR